MEDNKSTRDKTNMGTYVRKTTVAIITTVMIAYPLSVPHINAYFTDKITYGEMASSGLRGLSELGSGAIKLFFDVYRFNDLKADFDVRFADDILLVTLNLPEGFGFCAEDALNDSVKFLYDGREIEVFPRLIKTQGNELQLVFDWSDIERFIGSDDNSPGFEIAGKGAGRGMSGLGEKFTFQGRGKIRDLDWEYFDQSGLAAEIQGLRNIRIPGSGEDPDIYHYDFFLGGSAIPAEDVEWGFTSDTGGVRFNSGKLSVFNEATSGSVTIAAKLKSNRYFAKELGIELIKIIEELPAPTLAPSETKGGSGDDEMAAETPAVQEPEREGPPEATEDDTEIEIEMPEGDETHEGHEEQESDEEKEDSSDVDPEGDTDIVDEEIPDEDTDVDSDTHPINDGEDVSTSEKGGERDMEESALSEDPIENGKGPKGNVKEMDEGENNTAHKDAKEGMDT